MSWTRGYRDENDDLVVYDNEMGAAEDVDATTLIEGESIVIHDSKK
jgi:hypothetical protein